MFVCENPPGGAWGVRLACSLNNYGGHVREQMSSLNGDGSRYRIPKLNVVSETLEGLLALYNVTVEPIAASLSTGRV